MVALPPLHVEEHSPVANGVHDLVALHGSIGERIDPVWHELLDSGGEGSTARHHVVRPERPDECFIGRSTIRDHGQPGGLRQLHHVAPEQPSGSGHGEPLPQCERGVRRICNAVSPFIGTVAAASIDVPRGNCANDPTGATSSCT